MRARLVVSVLIGLSAAPLTAQQKGTIEIGGFGKFTDYSKSFEATRQSANAYGAGGRLGYFLNPRWELEVDGSGNATDVKNFFVGSTSTALTYYPFHVRLNFNQKLGQNSPFTWLIGAGPGYNRYGKNIAGLAGFRGSGFGSDWAVSGITGFRAKLTNWLDFRLDGTLDYIPSPNNAKAALIAQGITASSPPSNNTNLGLQAGLSVLPGTCSKAKDGTTISPTTASIPTGGSASFTGTATNCGKADQVVFTVSGPGSVDPSGRYTATTAGNATVTACGRANRLCSTATVTVAAPAPPPPPARTLTRCELAPAGATPRIDRPVTYTVTGTYSDGTTAPLPSATLSSPGGQVSGSAVSWSTPGTKTITADCGGGVTGQTTADVQQINVVVRDSSRSSARSSAFFKFNKAVIYRTNDQTSLNQVAQILKEHPDVKLVIDGHTDADGPVAYNGKLGMNRANAVKAYLASQGAPVDKMTIIVRSFGECVPVASNKTADGRAQNRRAELHEYGNTQPEPASATCKEAGRERKP